MMFFSKGSGTPTVPFSISIIEIIFKSNSILGAVSPYEFPSQIIPTPMIKEKNADFLSKPAFFPVGQCT